MMLSFVIVTYQSASVIAECLRYARAVPDSEIVVVDNASTDETRSLVTEAGIRPDVMPHNAGFAAAANAGAAKARGEVLCFLNPDCFITAEVCAAALQAIGTRKNVCAVPDFRSGESLVRGRQSGYTRTKLLADVMETAGWRSAIWQGLRKLPTLHHSGWAWPLGTCLFVPRETFLSLGGFDARYFLFMEDVEFGRALAAAGGEVVSLPHVVRHGGAEGAHVSMDERLRLLEGARLAYARRHYGRPFAALLGLVGRRASPAP
jgi:GT2 family glycosyltransferase